ncbi:DDE-type integrase/transposase/recombinase [Sporomusa sphaeroides]|uniref:DDE-type integrase/transposase/recombinase n=1 Tax=Sporomusa sphaeroides TaxID=47679 RepID=UPI002B59E755|nr:DDE-type integrase/transposase/recombinase [Sporomusa sphaeroides]HML32201.1 DDE-type integrase/transposase/recombinase [Sporomusa sphaeroides]
MKDQKKAEAIAVERVQLLSPLLSEDLDSAKARQIKGQICEQAGISERTLRRYLSQYRTDGFAGLKPKGKGLDKPSVAIAPHILEQAILLRREVPGRSIAQLIQILEWEGRVEPGQIKRSTLQEKLAERGYSTRHMRMYADSGVATRRFQQKHRNRLWHSDIKFGPYLPVGPDGSKKQVYLVTFIDDATRFVLHGEFYPTLDQIIVEDCLRQAISKYGVPEAVYFDNGKQYRTKWMVRTCSKLGIRLLFAKPYSPEATGKVERFNRVVDSFLSEAALEKPQTLDKLNALFGVWLDECYQNKDHSALGDKISPETAYRSDKKPLRFLDPETIANAFLHCEERKVDKAGCISFAGNKYEVGLTFIGCKVDVIYDPADTRELTIEYKGHTPWTVKKLIIGERTGTRPKLPEHLELKPANSSRLLSGAARQSGKRKEQQAPAVSYRTVHKEAERSV